MYRILIAAVAISAVLVMGSCANQKKSVTTEKQSDVDQARMSEIAPEGQGESTTARQPSDEPVQPVTPDEPASRYAEGGSNTHVVQAGDTLYGLARQYYDNESMWKKIWQANKDKIDDPNKLAPGMKLIIP